MLTALEMLVIENRAAHDREVAVAADEIMREEIDEIEKASESPRGYFHRHVLLVKEDAVLVIVNIRGILEIPSATGESKWDRADVLARWMMIIALESEVLFAKNAFRIGSRNRRFQELGDVFIVFLRL